MSSFTFETLNELGIHTYVDPETGEIHEAIDSLEPSIDPTVDEVVYASPFASPLGRQIGGEALEFLAKWSRNDAPLFGQMQQLPVTEALETVVVASVDGALCDTKEAGLECALRVYSQLMRQCTQIVFFELNGRELRRNKAQTANLPVPDPTQHSPAMLALLAKLQSQRPAIENPTDMADCDADDKTTANDFALKEWLEEVHDLLVTLHSETFATRYGDQPRELLGFTSVQVAENVWKEIDDLELAYQFFQESRAKAAQRKQAQATTAGANLLKFAAARRHVTH